MDESRVYFEDDGGDLRVAVVLHGGLLDSVASVRASKIARALLADEFRLVYVDHRGVGKSDKPHSREAYAMPLRVADAVAVLDELEIERAHFLGNSWGGRLGFGIGEHAPDRVLSLVIGGQQPYAIAPEGPLARVVTESLAASRREGTVQPFVEALEAFSSVRFPDVVRAQMARQRRPSHRVGVGHRTCGGRDLRGPPCLACAVSHLRSRRGCRLLRASATSGGRDPDGRVRLDRGTRPSRRTPAARPGAAGRSPYAAWRRRLENESVPPQAATCCSTARLMTST